MKTSSAKNKARLLQQHVAKRFREFLRLEENDAISRPMGSAGSDIIMSPLANRLLPISIECKNWKSFPSFSALDQSAANSKGDLPIAVWKPPRKPMDKSIYYMYEDDFYRLLELVAGNEELRYKINPYG